MYSLLPEDYRMSLIHLPGKSEKSDIQGNGAEAVLNWVLQVLIKPGHAVYHCENYVEKYEPVLLSAVSAHHLKFFKGHITCLLEHYMVAFKYLSPTVTAEELSNRYNWVTVSCPAKNIDVLVQHLKALLQQNRIVCETTILKIMQHVCVT